MEYGEEQKIISQKAIHKTNNINNKVKCKTRRGNWKRNKQRGLQKFKFSLLGTNCNGILNKKDSLNAAIDEFNPSVVTLQETKSRKFGNLKLKGYQIFEKLRNGGNGGGILTAADENMNPVLISTGKEDDSELLTIQVEVGSHNIRIINGYGPQEDECSKDDIYKFWQEIEEETLNAKDNNCLVIVQMDANAKIGKENLKDDPNTETPNGRILLDMCERQNLTILNTHDLCRGVITRERITVNNIERSIIDYIIVCEEMKQFLEEMFIDEDRIHVLTRYGKNKVKSDHNILFSKFSIQFESKPKILRKEFFNLKDKAGQADFLRETSDTESLYTCFSQNRTFPHNANIFYRKLNGCIRKCFKKVRVVKGGKICQKDGSNPIIENIKQKTELEAFVKNCNCPIRKKIAEAKLEEVEKVLNDKCSLKNAEMVKEYIKDVETDEGNFSQLKLWKLKQKLCPKSCDPPMAKKDEEGNLITSPELLKSLYLKTYQERLKNRDMKEELKDIFFLKEELWSSRMEELKSNKSTPWSESELRKALKSLKKNKTQDPNGMINELFMENCAGEDLIKALVFLMDGIKEHFHFPEYLLRENITTIFKNKGSRMDMNNDRGIFLLTTLKKILDKLIYQDKFDNIDKNMSCSNIGSRKGRNVKDHLFIIYGIINSVVNGSDTCIDMQIYDLVKAFDSLWLEDCMNDAFDTLDKTHRDDKLALLYESNKENLVAVNTPFGITSRISIPRIVQQGGTWGPCLCSNSVDTLGKKVRDRGESSYMYKDAVRILPLAMVDDINVISKCGLDSLNLNTFINSQIELKKLRFHVPDESGKSKCHKMHIGGKSDTCPQLKVHGTMMEVVKEDMYLGDLISCDGKNKKNIEKRISKGLGIITQILNLLEIVSFGSYYIEIALLLREAMFLNGILYNSEVWYGMTSSEMNEFEKLDRLLLRKILGAPFSTPQEAFYLELGIVPINIVIKSRRIQYLQNLTKRNNEEMIYQFLKVQWNNPTRGDWTETVRENLKEFEIEEDEEVFRSMTKEMFKNKVKKKARQVAFNQLIKRKDKHSKMENLEYSGLKIQTYFQLEGITTGQIRNIFKYRTRMAPYGENFRGGRESVACPLCKTHLDSQALGPMCPAIRKEISVSLDLNIVYSEDIDLETAKLVEKVLNTRNKIIQEINET